MDTWIHSMARTVSSRRVAAWSAALAIIALLAFARLRYLENFLRGPYDLGPADLDGIRDVSTTPRYFVRVSGSKAMNTGIQQITIRKRSGVETGRSVAASYYVLAVGDRLLVCRSQSGSHTTFEGELAPIPMDLDRRIFDSAEMRAHRPRFYPFYVNDESFRLPGYWAIGGGLVFGLLLLAYGVPAWKRWRDPSSHEVVRRAAGWGDPIGTAVTAERESRTPRFKGGNGWAVTDQFLIQRRFFSFDLLRLQDLLWAYKKVTKHSVNFIPTGKTYDACLMCYGGAATVQGKENTVDEILGFATQRAPWAIFGFSKELQEHFVKNTRAFCDTVEARKREWAQRARTQGKT